MSSQQENDSSLTARALTGILWSITGTGAKTVLRLAVVATLARLLTPDTFGLMAAASLVLGISEIFSRLGVGPALIQRSKLTDRHISVAFTLSLGLGILVSMGIALSAPFFSQFFQMPDLVSILRISILAFLFESLGLVSIALLKKELSFKSLALADLGAFILGSVVIGIPMAIMGMGVWSLVAAFIATSVTRSIVCVLIKPPIFGLSFDSKVAKELLSFGLPQTGSWILNYSAKKMDQIMVGRYLGEHLLGNYERAFNFVMLPSALVMGPLSNVLFPAMSEIQDKKERLQTGFIRAFVVASWGILPSAAFLIVFGPEVILVILGDQWIDAILPFQLLVPLMFLRGISKINGTLARAKGAVNAILWRHFLNFLVMLNGTYFAIEWGIKGLCLAAVVGAALHFSIMTQLSLRLLSLRVSALLGPLLRPVFVSALLGISFLGFGDMLRAETFPPIVVLSLGLFFSALLIGCAMRVFPRSWWGHEFNWAWDLLWPRIIRFLFPVLGNKINRM